MSKKKLIVALCGIFVLLGIGVCLVRTDVMMLPDSEPRINSEKLYAVTYIDDGDTFRINVDAHEVRVRMLGVNTPETVDPRKKVQCFGPEASAKTKSLLKGQRVRLAFNPDREHRDKYGRYLAYVYREDGLFINEFLIKNGFAREYTVGKAYDLQTEFRQLQTEAQKAHMGLWGACQNRD